jgi:hypothetical protein
MISAGAVACGGTIPMMGARNMNGKNRRPVTTLTQPVRPPTPTPEEGESMRAEAKPPERKLAGIDFHDVALGFSAAIVIMLMPFAFSITDGIAAGFIIYVVIRLFQGQAARVHPLMYLSAAAFALYFLVPILQQELSWV